MAVAKRAATPHAFPFYDDCERGLVMTARNLRAALTAILLGTATVGVTALALTAPAQALTASPKVGPLLKEAVTMIMPRTMLAPRPSWPRRTPRSPLRTTPPSSP